MLFNSPLYGVFLLGTWIVFWLLRRQRLPRALFLVGASYVFYFYGTWEAAKDEPVPLPPAWWAVLCLGVIFVGSTIDFFVGRALGRVRSRAGRNALLLTSIVYYLGVLAIFKYWNFAADSFASLFAALGAPVHVTHLRLVLPFGISFFTFETMSYTIDVWRGQLPPAKRYLDYLLFVCFFPHLVAGPIVRPAYMLPQLAADPRADAAMQARGLWRIATGLGKKIIIGDFLAQALVNRVFATPERFTALEVLLAVYGYAAQIYVDFSGYSDVAIGSAALFGYELPENFDAPYVSSEPPGVLAPVAHVAERVAARLPVQAARRLPRRGGRDVPQPHDHDGARRSVARRLVELRRVGDAARGSARRHAHVAAVARRGGEGSCGEGREGSAVARVVATLATFHFVCLAWIFFRAPTFAHATLALEQMARGAWTMGHIAPKVVPVIAVAMALHFVPRDWEARAREVFVRTPAVVQGLVLAAAAMAIHLAASAKPEPFVYGQF